MGKYILSRQQVLLKKKDWTWTVCSKQKRCRHGFATLLLVKWKIILKEDLGNIHCSFQVEMMSMRKPMMRMRMMMMMIKKKKKGRKKEKEEEKEEEEEKEMGEEGKEVLLKP